MFAMADVCMYLAIIWTLGPEAAASVTADMHSRFHVVHRAISLDLQSPTHSRDAI